jgi:hypothetical protein
MKRYLSVELFISQTSKNAMCFLLFLVFSSTKSENKRAEQVLPGSWDEVLVEERWAQRMYTHMNKFKNNKIKQNRSAMKRFPKCRTGSGSEVGGGEKVWDRRQGGEMTQTMYAHVNKLIKKKDFPVPNSIIKMKRHSVAKCFQFLGEKQ